MQGHPAAPILIGSIYEEGKGVPKDTVRAMDWYHKAAVRGNAVAQTRLGLMYQNGKDFAKAMEWYQKAAEQEDADAQYYLGEIYESGEGVPKDFVKAVGWFQKAAAQGHVWAQISLGTSYLFGKGIPPDGVRAYAWLNLAAAQGYFSARRYLAKAEIEMTAAQIAEGQFLSSNWKKGDTFRAVSSSRAGNTESVGVLSKQERAQRLL